MDQTSLNAIATSMAAKLAAQGAEAALRERYYRGEVVPELGGQVYNRAFKQLFRSLRANVCSLVVDSLVERIDLVGFRMGDEPEADADAHRIWQRNNLDAEAMRAHVDACTTAAAYVLVQSGDSGAEITVEHPAEVLVEVDPGDRRKRVRAIKTWTDLDGNEHVWLWTPEIVARSVKRKGKTSREWEAEANGLGVVPVVPLWPRPRTRGTPLSELNDITPLQDGLNKVIQDMMVAGEFVAFPQRYATGMEPPVDPASGQPVPPWKMAIDRLWMAESSDVQFGQLPAANLGNYSTPFNTLLQMVASISRVPPHYFILNGGNVPSGEALRSAEAGLVARARDRQRALSDAWEEVMRLAFMVEGLDTTRAQSAEVIWRNPEFRVESEMMDAASKKSALGVPFAQIWEDIGYTPQQIARFSAMRMDDALVSAMSTPSVSLTTRG